MTDGIAQEVTQDVRESMLRDALYKAVHAKYAEFSQAIASLPLAPGSLTNSYTFLSTAMLWAKEAIYFAPLATPPEG
jgi:hypothetical protein